jgi:hypothetical protein
MTTPALLLSLVSASFLSAGGRKLDTDKLPPPAMGKMDFFKDIQPIFERSCIRCHNSHRRGLGGVFRVGLRLDVNRDAALEYENGIVPGKSDQSSLIHAVSGLDITTAMPPQFPRDRLSVEEVGKLRAWIDQGAVWPEQHKFPDGFRLLSLLFTDVFSEDGGEKAWAASVERQMKKGRLVRLLIMENRAKMVLGRDFRDEPEFSMRPFIPPNTSKVRVFIPDLINARVEVHVRAGISEADWKRVWAHAENGSSLLSPEIEVANNAYGALEVRVTSMGEGPAGVSNILVLTPAGAAKK